MIKIGLVGLGHGKTLLQLNTPDVYRSRNDYLKKEIIPMKVTALCDTNEDVLSKFSKEYNIDSCTTDFNELIKMDDIDVVGIYTPGPLHAPQILAALDAGKHVMVTKSMVYTEKEAEDVVNAVDKSGLVLLVTQTMRCKLDMMEAKRACDAGEIGDLFMAESHYVHDLRNAYIFSPWRLEMPQDLILGGACHPIDLLRWYMVDFEEIHCYGLKSGIVPEYPKEDNFVMNLKFTSGKIGRVAAYLGAIHPPNVPMNQIALYGTKGSIIDNMKKIDPEGYMPQVEYSVGYPDTALKGHAQEMIIMLRHMYNCIVNGEKPWVGAREGARVVSTGLAAWESLKTGVPVKVRNEF